MERKRLWILGAGDPEMEAIAGLLREHDQQFVHAMVGGRRVSPKEAYFADRIPLPEGTTSVIFVECSAQVGDLAIDSPVHMGACDHHRPGDPGYSCGPADFLNGSSIGQVLKFLHGGERWAAGNGAGAGSWALQRPDGMLEILPAGHWILHCAAADHCLGAAYRGLCPGVKPEELLEWRIKSRAQHQGLDSFVIRANIQAAIQKIEEAPRIEICTEMVADLRGDDVPELPEAGAWTGAPILATPRPGPDGRKKVVLQQVKPSTIQAWVNGWAREHLGLTEAYGMPARGIAGAYEP